MRLAFWAIFTMVPLGALAGCGAGSKDSSDLQRSHVRLLAMLHVKTSNQLGHPPKDEAEFKQALAASNLKLDSIGVNSVDELFISNRDGKPLVVAYGSTKPKNDVIVYEQDGVDGVREVGYTLGRIAEVNAADFAKLVPAASNR